MTGQWSDRSAVSSCKTLSPSYPMSYLPGLAVRTWTSFWRREGFAGIDLECSNGAVKTACDIQVDGKCGPVRPKMTWKQLTEMDCRNWKLSSLVIDISGDLVWDLLCVQQASYLEGGPLMWMLPLYLHVNQKSDDNEDSERATLYRKNLLPLGSKFFPLRIAHFLWKDSSTCTREINYFVNVVSLWNNGGKMFHVCSSILILLLLNTTCPVLANSVDPDQFDS